MPAGDERNGKEGEKGSSATEKEEIRSDAGSSGTVL